jgi:hypothetical protein
MTWSRATQIRTLESLRQPPEPWSEVKAGDGTVYALAKTESNRTIKYWIVDASAIRRNGSGTEINEAEQHARQVIGTDTTALAQNLLDTAAWAALVKNTNGDYKVFAQSISSAGTIRQTTTRLAITEAQLPKTGAQSISISNILDADLATPELTDTGLKISSTTNQDRFSIYRVEVDPLTADNRPQDKIFIGHLITTKAPTENDPVSLNDGFFIDSSIDLEKISETKVNLFEDADKQNILLIWSEENRLSNSTYIDLKKGIQQSELSSPSSGRIANLSLKNFLDLEEKYDVDFNNDGLKNGLIKIFGADAAPVGQPLYKIVLPNTSSTSTAPITREIYKLTNGDLLEKNTHNFLQQNNTVTVNASGHGLSSEDEVYIDAPGNNADGIYTITIRGENSFSFTSRQPLGNPRQLSFFKTSGEYSSKQASAIFKTIQENDIINWEILQIGATKVDLNDDGVLGACVLNSLVRNENFGIYQTTLGSIVYAEDPDLLAGDVISSPIILPLNDPAYASWRSRLLLGDNLVASTTRSATPNNSVLTIGAVSRDQINDITTLEEVRFDIITTPPHPSIRVPTATSERFRIFSFDRDESNRRFFLEREESYATDLNNDGVIGNSIVKEIATSPEGAIFELASGQIFFSKNTQLNLAEKVSATDNKIFDFGKAPEKIFALRLSNNKLTLLYSSDEKYFSERFSLNSNNFTPDSNSKTELSQLDLTQNEIAFGVDIDANGIVGDTIASVAYGFFGLTPAERPETTSQDVGIYSLKSKTALNRDAYIFCADPSLKENDVQPTTNMYALKNSMGGIDPYWSIPTFNGKRALIVAAGLTDDSEEHIRIVLKENSNNNKYRLVTFDSTGATSKPRGNPLDTFALHNEEIRLNTDIDGDTHMGDAASKISSRDNFGIYLLEGSGRVVLTSNDAWESQESGIQQNSLDFISLRSTQNSAPWLPPGYTRELTLNGHRIQAGKDAASITQVAFNEDGSTSLYMTRDATTGNLTKEVLYNVEFNSKGITNNPLGKSLTQQQIFSQESSKQIDINGDDFIGKPFLGLEMNVGDGTPLPSGILTIKNPGDATANVIMKSGNTFSVIQGSKSFVKGTYPDWHKWTADTTSSKISLNEGCVTFYSNVKKETFLVASNDENDGFSVFDSNGKETYFTTNYKWARPVGTGDFNGDGARDILVISGDDSSIAVYTGDHKGKLKPSQKFSSPISVNHGTNANAYLSATASKITNDKFSDLVILQKSGPSTSFSSVPGTDQLAVYTNTRGSLRLSETIALGGGNDVQNITLGDLNRDGLDDLVLTRRSSNSIEIAFNAKGKFASGGEFIDSTVLSGVYVPQKTLLSDINYDGFKDILVLAENETEVSTLYAYFGRGNGDFLPAKELFSEQDIQTSRLSYINAPANILDFFIEDLNGDKQDDIVIHSTFHNSVIWNMAEAAFGTKKFNAPGGNKPVVSGGRPDVINFGQFYEDATALGLYPSILPSPNQKDLRMGFAEVSDMLPLRQGPMYTYLVDATNPTQLNITTGRSTGADISFSLSSSISVEYSANVPLELRPSLQGSANQSTASSYADAGRGSFSFIVDGTKSGENRVWNFGADDTLSYKNPPLAAGYFSYYLHGISAFALATNSKPFESHLLIFYKSSSNDGLTAEEVYKILPNTQGTEVYADLTNREFWDGIDLYDNDYCLDFSKVAISELQTDAYAVINGFNKGDTLLLPNQGEYVLYVNDNHLGEVFVAPKMMQNNLFRVRIENVALSDVSIVTEGSSVKVIGLIDDIPPMI